jgi:hypothetical protein
MDLYSLILKDKWVLEILYALTISIVCGIIVFKTDKFFRLSLHTGIRYFRNAFLFFGLAFIARYIFGVFGDLNIYDFYIVRIIFEYSLVMAGFFLLYSLIWKKIEPVKLPYSSSLFNSKVAVFHAMALLISVLDALWQVYSFMFISQIIIFFSASIIAYVNYRNDENRHKFPKFYFIAMLFSLAVWIMNLIVALYLEWDKAILVDIGIINVIFFLLCLYGVIKVTKQNGNKET